MSISLKSASLGAAVLAAIAVVANAPAHAAEPTRQVAQIPRAVGTVTLPPVVVRRQPPASWYDDLYTSGRAERPSSLSHRPFYHYKVPVGYDSNMAMHPYTSGFGPCAEGASPSQGCRQPTSNPMPASHYERPPFNQ